MPIGTTNPLTTTLAAGHHNLTVKATNGACSTTSSGFSVDVNQPIAVSGSVTTAADCAGNVTLTATASGGAGGFTYQWSEGNTSLGTGNPLTIKLTPGNHSVTVKATDSANCTLTSDPFTVHVNQPVSATAAAGTPDCAGKVTLTATPSGGTGTYSSYQWFDGGTPLATGASPLVTLTPGDHSITVMVTDNNTPAGCSGTSTAIPVHINQPVSTSLDTGSAPDCTGHLTFTAAGAGGTGTYTFAWTIDGKAVVGNTGPTLAYAPTVDCSSHVVAVTAKDSANCPSGNTATRTVTQVVTSTVN